jgi:hypothetical protein
MSPSPFHEFVSADTPALCVVVRSPDHALIPAAAGVCCREWVYHRQIRPGDGSLPRELADALAAQIATVGYLLYRRPDSVRTAAPALARLPG